MASISDDGKAAATVTAAQAGGRRRIPWVRAVAVALPLSVLIWGLGLAVASLLLVPRPERTPELAARARLVVPAGRDGVPDVARAAFAFPLPVAMDELPPVFVDLLLFDEDRRFLDHPGVDPRGLLRALLSTLAGRTEGGSTLTQQLAKQLFLSERRSPLRKMLELGVALRLERALDKAAILGAYLHTAYFGSGLWGIEAAARGYFGKRARCLSPLEAAMLVRTLKAPSRRNPRRRARALAAEARALLIRRYGAREAARMLRRGGRRGPGCRPRLSRLPPSRFYGRDAVLDRVQRMLPPHVLARPLVIYTTLDPELQLYAELAVRGALAERARLGFDQIALVAMDPWGRVRALVGGADYARSPWNRALRARRQPGSAFKPLVYLAALEAGWRMDDRVDDTPLVVDGYAPRNIDRRFLGRVTLREALVKSRNVATVRLAERVGRRRIVALARRLGYGGVLPDDPTLALGSGETTLLDLVELYATLANGGTPVRARFVEAVRHRDGGFVGDPPFPEEGPAGGAPPRIATAPLCGLIHALEAVVRQGTGRRARFAGGHRVAGKTGTSQTHRDAWFVGFSAYWVVGVWIGRDDDRPMAGRPTGGDLPARVFARFMVNAHLGRPPRPRLGPCP